MAKTELRYRHQLNGILAIYFEGEGLRRLRKIEKLVEEQCGVAWLNSGRAKDILFGVLCAGAKAIAPDAIVIVTAADKFVPTDAFEVLPDAEKDRLFRDNHPRDMPQYFQPHDILISLAQTPERVCLYHQRFDSKRFQFIGEAEVKIGPQDGFDGRLKMYGVEPPEEIIKGLYEMVSKRMRPQ